jgi:hypothetical protein
MYLEHNHINTLALLRGFFITSKLVFIVIVTKSSLILQIFCTLSFYSIAIKEKFLIVAHVAMIFGMLDPSLGTSVNPHDMMDMYVNLFLLTNKNVTN